MQNSLPKSSYRRKKNHKKSRVKVRRKELKVRERGAPLRLSKMKGVARKLTMLWRTKLWRQRKI